MPSGVRCCGGSGFPGRRATHSLAGAGRSSDVVHPPVQETQPVPYRDPDKRRAHDRERHRRRTEQRRAQGRCTHCGKNRPESGRSQCEACLDKRRAADRRRASQRKAAGINRVRDPEARKAEYRRARRRADQRVAQGNCARCGRHPHEPDRRLCAACGERARRRDRERYARAREAGLKYGGRDVGARRKLARRRSRKRRQRRRDASLCVRCGRRAPVENGSSCGTCLNARYDASYYTFIILSHAPLGSPLSLREPFNPFFRWRGIGNLEQVVGPVIVGVSAQTPDLTPLPDGGD